MEDSAPIKVEPTVANVIGRPTAPDIDSGKGRATDAPSGERVARLESHAVRAIWFGTFLKHLRWSEPEAQGVHEELDSHVLDRTRDLMLSGMPEDSAIQQALNELGDAAGLAHRYRLTRTLPFRRFMMNATIFLGTGAALALSILAVSSKHVSFQPDPSPVSRPAIGQGGKQQPGVPLVTIEPRLTLREVRVYPLRHTEATNVALELQLHLRSLSTQSDGGLIGAINTLNGTATDTAVTADPRSNSLVLSTTPEVAKVIDAWIATHDTAPAQPAAVPAGEQANPSATIVTSQYTPEPRLPGEMGQRPVTGSFKNTPLGEALSFVGQSLNMQVIVHWTDLEPQGISKETPISIEAKNVPLTMLLDMIEAQAKTQAGAVRLAVRADKQLIEFASDEFFDRRETSLISYDLTPIQGQVGDDAIIAIIQNFVEPEGWKDNGGSTAELKLGGRKMFVRAPKRFHKQIEWFLKELGASEVTHGK